MAVCESGILPGGNKGPPGTSAGFDSLFRVLVRGGYQAYIGLYRLVPTDAVKGLAFDEPQEADLDPVVNGGNFVQKNRASVRPFEGACAMLRRPRYKPL
jgi:hypothetical protein